MLPSKWRRDKKRTEMKDKSARVNTSHTVHGVHRSKYDHILETQMVLLVEREPYLCGFRSHHFCLLSIGLHVFSLKRKKKIKFPNI